MSLPESRSEYLSKLSRLKEEIDDLINKDGGLSDVSSKYTLYNEIWRKFVDTHGKYLDHLDSDEEKLNISSIYEKEKMQKLEFDFVVKSWRKEKKKKLKSLASSSTVSSRSTCSSRLSKISKRREDLVLAELKVKHLEKQQQLSRKISELEQQKELFDAEMEAEKAKVTLQLYEDGEITKHVNSDSSEDNDDELKGDKMSSFEAQGPVNVEFVQNKEIHVVPDSDVMQESNNMNLTTNTDNNNLSPSTHMSTTTFMTSTPFCTTITGCKPIVNVSASPVSNISINTSGTNYPVSTNVKLGAVGAMSVPSNPFISGLGTMSVPSNPFNFGLGTMSVPSNPFVCSQVTTTPVCTNVPSVCSETTTGTPLNNPGLGTASVQSTPLVCSQVTTTPVSIETHSVRSEFATEIPNAHLGFGTMSVSSTCTPLVCSQVPVCTHEQPVCAELAAGTKTYQSRFGLSIQPSAPVNYCPQVSTPSVHVPAPCDTLKPTVETLNVHTTPFEMSYGDQVAHPKLYTPQTFNTTRVVQPKVDAGDELVKALRQVANIPKIEYMHFDGDPIKYVSFMHNFETCLEKDNSDDSTKLQLLIQHCTGKAREAIETCVNLPPHEGFKTAKNTLKENFGRAHIIARAHVSKLENLPTIKTVDGPTLLTFARKLEETERTLRGMGPEYMSDIDHMNTLKGLHRKLPMFLRAKWTEIAGKIIDCGKRPKFVDFLKFIKNRAKLVNNEFGDDMRVTSFIKEKSRGRERSSAGGYAHKATTLATRVNNE